MSRTNGSLIGIRRTTNLVSAPGIWSLDEQVLGQRSSSWPVADPTPGLSPILWYDFSDESTVSVSGSQITTVTGKGSRNWTLSGSSFGPGYVTGINGRKCADWGSVLPNGKRLLTTDNTSTTVVESYFVLDSSFGATFGGFYGIFGKGAGAGAVTGSSGTTGFYGSGGIATEAYVNGSGTNNYSSGILQTINSPALLRLTGGTFTTTAGIVIGNDPQQLGARGWSGLIGEVIMFSSALSTDNRTKLQSYLASKWGLTLV